MCQIRYVTLQDPGLSIQVDRPTVQIVQDLMERLGESIEFFHIDCPQALLTISGSNSGRVRVRFARASLHDSILAEGWSNARLVDEAYVSSDEAVEVFSGGMEETVRLYETVPKDIALRATEHFLEHQQFPNDLIWARIS